MAPSRHWCDSWGCPILELWGFSIHRTISSLDISCGCCGHHVDFLDVIRLSLVHHVSGIDQNISQYIGTVWAVATSFHRHCNLYSTCRCKLSCFLPIKWHIDIPILTWSCRLLEVDLFPLLQWLAKSWRRCPSSIIVPELSLSRGLIRSASPLVIVVAVWAAQREHHVFRYGVWASPVRSHTVPAYNKNKKILWFFCVNPY